MAQRKRRRKQLAVTDLTEHLQHVNLNAAGIDVGSDGLWWRCQRVATKFQCAEFGAFTTDLQALADWLTKCEITTVAMESTGVYWIGPGTSL